MTMLNAFVSEPALLTARTVNVNVLLVVGVPAICPSDASVNPVGRLPLCSDHVIGPEPVAASVVLYALPSEPLGSEVVVIAGGVAVVDAAVLMAALRCAAPAA